jgi:3-oxoacyl-[acyl-carrier protein] reductase
MSRVAVVSGGSRGIGAEVAARLSLDGFRVVVNDSSTEDITDPAAVRRLFDRAGEVDLLVACAGAHAKRDRPLRTCPMTTLPASSMST